MGRYLLPADPVISTDSTGYTLTRSGYTLGTPWHFVGSCFFNGKYT